MNNQSLYWGRSQLRWGIFIGEKHVEKREITWDEGKSYRGENERRPEIERGQRTRTDTHGKITNERGDL